jgi:ABC-type molybdenum transport system ATPase subunit/photorepair protein PhrA
VYNVAPPHSAPESWKAVRFLAFAKQSETGEFTDYTARYGSLEPEDRELTRDRMLSFFTGENEDLGKRNVDLAMVAMELMHVRDIPAIALSSGQTRRMRLGLGIMMRPQLLILEDPMAGLDKLSRVTVSEILSDINATQDNPRVMVVLRDMGEETLADWITNVIEVRDGNVWVGTRDEYDARQEKPDASDRGEELPDGNTSSSELPVVRLRGASVSYGEGSRQVLKNVNWTIRPGDRWHLRGSNGESPPCC